MLELGEDRRVIQEIMGHARLEVTDGYTHVGEEPKRRAAERMDRHLRSGTTWAQKTGSDGASEP